MKISIEEKQKRNKQRCHLWYIEHKDFVVEKSKIWQQKLKIENPEKFYEISNRGLKKYRQTPKGIYSAIKQNSRIRGRIFPISQVDFVNWYEGQKKVCYYCGISQGTKRMSIDRKDNNLPYQLDNIVLACDDCNGVKGNILTENEMLIVGNLVMQKRWKK